ncbi:MAG: phosphopyruvate hydratase [Patescibacteria group bacterium]|nr:phosphopyruvate hydratase [Patescibacteria group bacterium]
MKIKKIKAHEILDSRGNPTVETTVVLESGIKAKAAVPSGASIGTKEAKEIRDGDQNRFGGKGVLKACQNVDSVITPALIDKNAEDQVEIDKRMLQLDGTENKEKLGANAILSVSLAVARAAAARKNIPLWKHIVDAFSLDRNISFPIPGFNVINGGAHSDSGLDIQEYMVLPVGLDTFEKRFQAGSEIYHILRESLKEKGYRVAIGDEGGFAPRLETNQEALQIIIGAINKSNYELGGEIKTGIDAAASEFYDAENKTYDLALDKKTRSNDDLLEMHESWIDEFHMEAIEDPMSEFDWDGWIKCNKRIGKKVAIVGDDLTVTNKKIIREAHERDAINTVLIKANQIGSLTETIESINTAREFGMKIFLSHRSGETIDDFVSDLAVAVAADYVKFGAPARGERVSKYNRILEIERSLQ